MDREACVVAQLAQQVAVREVAQLEPRREEL
jgi:hypothetical protein